MAGNSRVGQAAKSDLTRGLLKDYPDGMWFVPVPVPGRDTPPPAGVSGLLAGGWQVFQVTVGEMVGGGLVVRRWRGTDVTLLSTWPIGGGKWVVCAGERMREFIPRLAMVSLWRLFGLLTALVELDFQVCRMYEDEDRRDLGGGPPGNS